MESHAVKSSNHVTEIENVLINNLSRVLGAKKLQPTSRALCCWDIYFRPPTTAAKFIIKSSLFLQKFKDAGQAETEDWLCF